MGWGDTMERGRRMQLFDVVDHVHRSVVKRPDLPPLSLRAHVGPLDEFEQVPNQYIACFKLLCGLEAHESVLDIGCGTGRFATRLYERPNFHVGRYRGFDVEADAIEWAQRHVTPIHPNATFAHLDVRNTHYNPHGRLAAESLEFPYGDEEFDFAFAMSVFTHLTTNSAANYLRETARVLRPGGRALLTWHLTDGKPATIRDVGRHSHERFFEGVLVRNRIDLGAGGTIHWQDGCGTPTPTIPEIATIYDRVDMEGMAADAGLVVAEIHLGAWRQAEGLAFQDMAILHKPG